ncbi:sensor domain-containing diguanylate cyclase [Lysinibacillus sp. NPDC093712]|uniref:sensor domain-containing diguanylate cyclase n=1 Tax=Lysinibacillus sp. NPDC093712 TaxID=3390579 RepID=UPI003D092AFE
MNIIKKVLWQNKIRNLLRRGHIVIIFIISLCIFIPTIFIEYQQTINHQKEEMTNYLDAQTYFFESWLKERSEDIHTISNLAFVKGYQYEQAQAFFQEYKKQTVFTDLVFVNKEGIVQFDTVTEYQHNGIGIDVKNREYFQVAQKTKQQYITDVLISKVTKEPIIAFASPILDEQQQFNGVVFGTVNFNTVDLLLNESRVGFKGHAYIVNQDGTLLTELVSKKKEVALASQNILSQNYNIDERILMIAQSNKMQSPINSYKDANGEWVLAKSKPINQGKWYFISEVNLLEAYTSLLKRFGLLAICILVGTFLTIKVMLMITKKIEEPIQQLLKGVGKVEQGHYDYKINEKQLAPYAKEFQELCSSFNEMSAKVKEDTILLKELSVTCQLTKLYNRRYLIEQGELVFQDCKNNEYHCSCIAIDIDFFKKVNDTYGHLTGDEVLKHVAKIIKESVRIKDITTRYGGEEFVILSPVTTLESAVKIAERIRKNVEEYPFTIGEQCIPMTVSVGIAEFSNSKDISTFYDLIDKADQALYVAKESGRNMLRVYDGANNFVMR